MAVKRKRRRDLEAQGAAVEEYEVSEQDLALEEDDAEEEEELELYRVVPEAPRVKALIYGEPGCGKTTLAASAQDHDDMGPVLFANIEGGLLSVAHRGDIHAVNIGSTDELYALYRKLRRKKAPYNAIGTLAIDNVSELQALNLDEIVRKEMEEAKKKKRQGKHTSRVSPDEIFQEDYGISTVQLGRLFRWFKNLDLNIILTSHAKFVYPPQGKNQRRQPAELAQVEPIAVLPMLTQKLMKSVMGLVDFVWFMEFDAETGDRLMLTRPDGIRQAKTRGPLFIRALGNVVENPTMPQLYDTLVKSSSKKPSRKEK